jgi:hypothetical protein
MWFDDFHSHVHHHLAKLAGFFAESSEVDKV